MSREFRKNLMHFVCFEQDGRRENQGGFIFLQWPRVNCSILYVCLTRLHKMHMARVFGIDYALKN